MGPENARKYTAVLDEKIAKAEEARALFEEARARADSRSTSRYDTQREIFNNDANVQTALLHRMGQLREVINVGPKTKIEVGAMFSVDLWDEEETIKAAVYSPVSAEIDGLTFVTPTSPIGRAIEGMVAGNTFVYDREGKLLAGRIESIE